MLNALWIALSTYSRLPVPKAEWTAENKRYSLCFFPLVGVAVGAALLGWLWLCQALDLGPLLKGAGAAAMPLLLTGGIHMDGFLDTADALASWQSAEKRLEILKDTHVGAFAVIYGCLYLLVQAGIYAEAAQEDALPLALGFVLSRALSGLAAALLRPARPQGMLGGFTAAADKRWLVVSMAAYLALAGGALLLLSPLRGVLGLTACGLCFLGYRVQAYRRFGGVTGDLAGHFLQLCELFFGLGVIIAGRL